MVRHIQAIVNRLLEIVPLGTGDIALDIGSNDGTLLSFYPAGSAELVGIDPAEKFGRFYKAHTRLIPGFFSAELFKKHFGNRKARIVTSIAMLYDLEEPLSFMGEVREILSEDGIWHFEQSYLPSMLKAKAYDTICHEHLEYYSLKQIKFMTDRVGLKIIDAALNGTNGGSFAVTVARNESHFKQNLGLADSLSSLEAEIKLESQVPFARFRNDVTSHREKLVGLLQRLKLDDRSVFGYGASTKGNVILQYCGITPKDLPFIAEVNEDKFGCLTPGSWIPIISEEEARSLDPDFFLVQPWHFREGILKREQAFLNNGGGMIFPLPEIDICPPGLYQHHNQPEVDRDRPTLSLTSS
jgi:hypothetical protein